MAIISSYLLAPGRCDRFIKRDVESFFLETYTPNRTTGATVVAL